MIGASSANSHGAVNPPSVPPIGPASPGQSALIAGRVSKTLRRQSLRSPRSSCDPHARTIAIRRPRLPRPAPAHSGGVGGHGPDPDPDGGAAGCRGPSCPGPDAPRNPRHTPAPPAGSAVPCLPAATTDRVREPLPDRSGLSAAAWIVPGQQRPRSCPADVRAGGKWRAARWGYRAVADVCPRPERSRRVRRPPSGGRYRHRPGVATLVCRRQRSDHDPHPPDRGGDDATGGRAHDAHHFLGGSHLARGPRLPGRPVDGGSADLGPRGDLLGRLWPRHLGDGDGDGDGNRLDPPGAGRHPGGITRLGLPCRCHAAAGGPVRSRQQRRDQLALSPHRPPRIPRSRPSCRLHVAGRLPVLRTPGRALADVDVVDPPTIVGRRQPIAPLGGDQ